MLAKMKIKDDGTITDMAWANPAMSYVGQTRTDGYVIYEITDEEFRSHNPQNSLFVDGKLQFKPGYVPEPEGTVEIIDPATYPMTNAELQAAIQELTIQIAMGGAGE